MPLTMSAYWGESGRNRMRGRTAACSHMLTYSNDMERAMSWLRSAVSSSLGCPSDYLGALFAVPVSPANRLLGRLDATSLELC